MVTLLLVVAPTVLTLLVVGHAAKAIGAYLTYRIERDWADLDE